MPSRRGSTVQRKVRRPGAAWPGAPRLSSVLPANTSKSSDSNGGAFMSDRLPMPRTSSSTVAGTSRAVRVRSQLQRALSAPTAPPKPAGAPGGSGFTCTRTGWLRTTISCRGTRPLSHSAGSFEPGWSSASRATASPDGLRAAGQRVEPRARLGHQHARVALGGVVGLGLARRLAPESGRGGRRVLRDPRRAARAAPAARAAAPAGRRTVRAAPRRRAARPGRRRRITAPDAGRRRQDRDVRAAAR